MADGFKITMTIPVITGIPDTDKAKNKAGEALAARVRSRLLSGQTLSGTPLPKTAEGAASPLDDTGDLIRSIQYDKKTGRIAPSANRKQVSGSLTGGNRAILAIQIKRQRIDPMGVDRNADVLVNEEASKQLAVTLRSKGLSWRPKRIR